MPLSALTVRDDEPRPERRPVASFIAVRNGTVIVDEQDIPILQDPARNWEIRTDVYGLSYCLSRKMVGGTRAYTWLHRLLLNAPEELQVDHINRNGLDNRRVNLRLAEPWQNGANRRSKESQSGFRGVSRSKYGFQAYIKVNNVYHGLGVFPSDIAAALAFDEAARRFRGEFAVLNFPDGIDDQEVQAANLTAKNVRLSERQKGGRWGNVLEQRLCEMWGQGMGPSEIGRLLGFSKTSVDEKRRRLGLPSRAQTRAVAAKDHLATARSTRAEGTAP